MNDFLNMSRDADDDFAKAKHALSKFKDADDYVQYVEYLKSEVINGYGINDARDLYEESEGHKITLIKNTNRHMGPKLSWMAKEVKEGYVICVIKYIGVHSAFSEELLFVYNKEEDWWSHAERGSEPYKHIQKQFKALSTLKNL